MLQRSVSCGIRSAIYLGISEGGAGLISLNDCGMLNDSRPLRSSRMANDKNTWIYIDFYQAHVLAVLKGEYLPICYSNWNSLRQRSKRPLLIR